MEKSRSTVEQSTAILADAEPCEDAIGGACRAHGMLEGMFYNRRKRSQADTLEGEAQTRRGSAM